MQGEERSQEEDHVESNPIPGIKVCDEQDLLQGLWKLSSTFSSSYGPSGRLKMFQYPGDGDPIITSSSSVLISHLKPALPLVDILINGVKNHLKLFKDGGKFVILLTANIVSNQLRTLQSRVLCTRVNDYILTQMLSWIEANMDSNPLLMKLDFANISQLVSCVSAILSTKTLCSLSKEDITHLAILIIRGFLQTVSFTAKTDFEERFQIVSAYGSPSSKSELFHGLLIPTTEYDQMSDQMNGKAGPLKVALFLESLTEEAHGLEENSIDKATLTTLKQGVMDFLILVVDKLSSLGMNVLLNQKVVSPYIKRHLKIKGVIVVDRLGQALIPAVLQLIRSQPISLLETVESASVFGTLSSLRLVEFHSKRYINLRGLEDEAKTRTLLLCSLNEVMVDELKIGVESAQCFLYQAMRRPVVVGGAGCFESQLANMIRMHMTENSEELSRRLHCSRADVLSCAKTVITSFKHIAHVLSKGKHEVLFDCRSGHAWTGDLSTTKDSTEENLCCCGSVMRKDANYSLMSYFEDIDSIFAMTVNRNSLGSCTWKARTPCTYATRFPGIPDLLSCKKNAICVAFGLANVILRVKYCLVDKS